MTRRRLGVLIVAVAGLSGAGGSRIGLVVGRLWAERVTTSRLSPDETLRVRLVELGPDGESRAIAICLERLSPPPGAEVKLFDGSVDAGPLAGTERFVWSRDGSKVLLVGRHFFVRDDLMLANGDQMFFLYDFKSSQSYLNAADGGRLPHLTADQIAGIEFTEPVVLQPRAQVDPDSSEKRE